MAYIGESCGKNEELLNLAVEKCMWGAFYNSGQSRTGLKAILVHESIQNKFTNLLSKRVFETFILDDPMKETTNFGTIPDREYIL
jgi:acyl-CoA reductase-like NAD-dependent aldehyde dehydrogenase